MKDTVKLDAGKKEDWGCIVWAIIIVAAIVAISVYWGNDKPAPPERIDHIARVFMHEPGRFSLLIRRNDGSLTTKTISARNVRFFEDVPGDEELWAKLNLVHTYDRVEIELLEIHLHSARDVGGGGWNHGKFGRGQTEVIQ